MLIQMKKTLVYLLLTFACCNIMFSQQHDVLTLKETLVASEFEKDGWVGNTNLSMFARLQDAEAIIAPRQINPEVNGLVTSLKFYHHPYQEYNSNSYTIKVYENIDLQLDDAGQMLYDYTSCGDLVYSQDYTASGDGWQIVEFTTPYVIPDGEFWIGVQMHGMGTLSFGDADNAVEGQYYFSDMLNYTWYWSLSYFFDSSLWQNVLYSLGMAIYVEDYAAADEALGTEVAVFPNPAKDQFQVKAEALQQITVVDLSGRIVRNEKVSGDFAVINVNDLRPGMYYVNVVTANGSRVKRLEVVR